MKSSDYLAATPFLGSFIPLPPAQAGSLLPISIDTMSSDYWTKTADTFVNT